MADLMEYKEFRKGDATASEIQVVVDEVLCELGQAGSSGAQSARAAGLSLGDLLDVKVEIKEGQQGFEPITTSILVGIAISAGGKVTESLWKDVLWPRIRRRLGATAVKEPLPDSNRVDES